MLLTASRTATALHAKGSERNDLTVCCLCTGLPSAMHRSLYRSTRNETSTWQRHGSGDSSRPCLGEGSQHCCARSVVRPLHVRGFHPQEPQNHPEDEALCQVLKSLKQQSSCFCCFTKPTVMQGSPGNPVQSLLRGVLSLSGGLSCCLSPRALYFLTGIRGRQSD